MLPSVVGASEVISPRGFSLLSQLPSPTSPPPTSSTFHPHFHAPIQHRHLSYSITATSSSACLYFRLKAVLPLVVGVSRVISPRGFSQLFQSPPPTSPLSISPTVHPHSHAPTSVSIATVLAPPLQTTEVHILCGIQCLHRLLAHCRVSPQGFFPCYFSCIILCFFCRQISFSVFDHVTVCNGCLYVYRVGKSVYCNQVRVTCVRAYAQVYVRTYRPCSCNRHV